MGWETHLIYNPFSGVGLYNTFAISATGEVAGWGLNNSGQLGVAKKDQEDNLVWAPVKIDSLKQVGDQQGLVYCRHG